MAARNSRKRSVPARLREEVWYLVEYEEDENLRVLAEDEIRHIFSDEEEDSEMQIGDIVSALWIPNGRYYDAKILAKGGDKNELMRERMRKEKAKTNGDKETEENQKRKSPEKTGGQKKKQKTQKQTESAKEKEQKAKDRKEKQKKKDQDQERQNMMLEARKAQAASRWAANDEIAIVNNPANATFTPQPIRQANSSSSSQSSTPLTPANTPLSSDRTPNTSTKTTPESTPGESLPANTTLSRRPTISSKSKGSCSEPRRGLHFQSATVDSSDEEIDEEVEIIPEESETDVSSSDCCKEQRLETKALRKRLEKVHKRLNIALKAKTTAEVVNN